MSADNDVSETRAARIRPITTGDIGVANIGRHRFRLESSSVYASILPADEDNTAYNSYTHSYGTVSEPHAAETTKIRRPRAMHHHPAASTSTSGVSHARSTHATADHRTGINGTHQGNHQQQRPSRERRDQGDKTERRSRREVGDQGGKGENNGDKVGPSERITDLWASLNHFSRNNLGRSLKEEAEEELADNVHFVNIEKSSGMSPRYTPRTPTNPQAGVKAPFMQKMELVEQRDGKVRGVQSSLFLPPELPRGAMLRIDILSTWGDMHYVGLNGIEIFTASGAPLSLPPSSISASPPSINILPEYQADPRVARNLLDGVNVTCDDLHMWLAPFTPGQRHSVSIRLDAAAAAGDSSGLSQQGLGMLRLWNYNKSRIHASRGARYVQVSLDGVLLHKGEVRRASGALSASNREDIFFVAADRIADMKSKVARFDPVLREELQGAADAADAGVDGDWAESRSGKAAADAALLSHLDPLPLASPLSSAHLSAAASSSSSSSA
eukprot:gene39963-48679_t